MGTRFRPPSLSGSSLLNTSNGQQSTVQPDMNIGEPTTTPITMTINTSISPDAVLYQGPPTPSFHSRRPSQSPSPAPGPLALSPTPSITSPGSGKLPPPKRAPPQRPSQVAADGAAPIPTTNTNTTPLQTESMTMDELLAITTAATATAPTTTTSVRCDSDSTHIARLYCPDCEEHFCLDCDTLVHSRKKFAHHQRRGIETTAPAAPMTGGLNTPIKKGPPPLPSNGMANGSPSNVASPITPLNVTSPISPTGSDILYVGPTTPSFARKQSILANKNANPLSPNTPLTSTSSNITSPNSNSSPIISSPPSSNSTAPSSTTGPSDSNSLPDGWIEYLDQATGRPYYHHAQTQTTVWIRPTQPTNTTTPATTATTTATPTSNTIDNTSDQTVALAAAAAAATAAALQQQRELDERLKREAEERALAEAAKLAELERTRLEAELEHARVLAASENERLLMKQRMEHEFELERSRTAAAAEVERLKSEAAFEAERLRAAAQLESDRVRAELARETDRLREEQARVLAETELMKERMKAEAEADRQRIEKEALQAKLAAMELRLQEEEKEKERTIRLAAEREEAAQAAAAAAIAAAARLEEENRRQAEEQQKVAALAAAQALAQAQAEAAAEAERKQELERSTKLATTSNDSSTGITATSLPPNWIEYVDASSGRPYYFNTLTNATVWIKPEITTPHSNTTTDSITSISTNTPTPSSQIPSAPPLSLDERLTLLPKRGSVIIKSQSVDLTPTTNQPQHRTSLSVSNGHHTNGQPRRGSILPRTINGEFHPPPPKRGSVSMFVSNHQPDQPTTTHLNSHPPPLARTSFSLTPKRDSVIIKGLASADALSTAIPLADDSDDDENIPDEPPPTPTPAAIAERRMSMALTANQSKTTNNHHRPSTTIVINGHSSANPNRGSVIAAPTKLTTTSNTNHKPSISTPSSTSTPSAASVSIPVDEWRAVDDGHGQVYWYNRRTRETSWVNPTLQTDTANTKRINKNSPWKEYKDKKGTAYYHHTTTNETRWDVPDGFYLDDEADSNVSTVSETSSVSTTRVRPNSITSDVGLDSDEDGDSHGHDGGGSDDDLVDDDEEDEDEDVAELAAMGGFNQTNHVHQRTVSDATGLARPNTMASPGAASLTPLTIRPTSASVAITSTGSGLLSPKSPQKSKCFLNECTAFSVRDGYCLRHIWRRTLVREKMKDKLTLGQSVAALEIVTTEKSYLEQLRTIQRAFIARLQTSITLFPTFNRPPLITEDDLKKIFGNVSEILSISEELYADLSELRFYDRLIEFVGPTLLHYVPRFAVYAAYLEGFDDSRKRLTYLKEINHEFNSFITITEKVEGLSLDSFLVTPVQRLPRYILLLKELIRRLPSANDQTNPGSQQILTDLNAALTEFGTMTTTLNSSLNTAEYLIQLKNLSRLFLRSDSRFQSFLKPTRKLLKYGIIKKKFSTKSYNLQSYKAYYFFLTNDLIWYAAGIGSQQQELDSTEATANGQSHLRMLTAMNSATSESTQPIYKMKHMYRLEDMSIGKNDPKATMKALKKGANPLKFYLWNNDGRTIVLQAATEQEREQWFQAIESAIEACKKSSTIM